MMHSSSAARPAGYAPVIALAAMILIVCAFIGVMVEMPATIPTWCAAHGCP